MTMLLSEESMLKRLEEEAFSCGDPVPVPPLAAEACTCCSVAVKLEGSMSGRTTEAWIDTFIAACAARQ
jgi:hypothetical protein